MMRSDDTLCS